MGLWSKANSASEGSPQSKGSRPHLYVVPNERRSGSLRDALNAAGHDTGPPPEKPVLSPEVAEAKLAQLEGFQARQLAQRYAPDRTEPTLPAYWKSARRERRRVRLRDGVAWIATMIIIGGIMAVAAQVLVGPALNGEKPFVAQQ